MQVGLGGGLQHRTLICCVAQEGSKEKNDAKNEEKIIAKEETQLMAEEKLEEVDLGIDLQKPRPISISSKLSEEEKFDLIQLLKELKDVFA